MDENITKLLTVSFDAAKNQYKVEIPQGSNVAESAFCVTVLIKTFIANNIIKDKNEFLDLVNKYCDDPQYEALDETTDKKEGD